MDTLERREDTPRPARPIQATEGRRALDTDGAHRDEPAGAEQARVDGGDATPDDRLAASWVPVDEVVRSVGITEAMAYRLIKRGVLVAHRPPRQGGAPDRGRAHVSHASLTAYLHARVSRATRDRGTPGDDERAAPSRPAPGASGMTRALALHAGGSAAARSDVWASLEPDEVRRRAVAAAHARDPVALWALTEAWLIQEGKAGGRTRAHTLRAYRRGVLDLVAAWPGENLLHPARRAATRWVRALEDAGKKPATVQLKLAAARALYAALRWAGATDAAPFAGVHAAPEKTAPWDRRKPYTPADVERLLAVARGEDRALVLLGAHAGLRVSEALALRHADVRLADAELDVRDGKGGKARTVPVSDSLAAALRALMASGHNLDTGAQTGAPDDGRMGAGGHVRVLRLRDDRQARLRLRRLAATAAVPYRGYHALRHYCGTRLMRETGDLDTVARVLGHRSIETARVYAKWSDEGAKTAMGRW